MCNGLYNDFTNNCNNIIANNNAKNSINIISNMIRPGTENKIGNVLALKIYKKCADSSVEYDSNK